MKKLIAIILSVLCLASCLAVPGYAAGGNIVGDVVEDYIGVTKEDEIIDEMQYGIHYELQVLTTVKLMYSPMPTITFKAPTTAKVTTDTPLSVDYEFVCWQHAETGKHYYPGDTIEVDGIVTLYAVFEEKDDNHPQFIRYILTGLEALKRLLKSFLRFDDAMNETDTEFIPVETTAA